MSMQLAAIGTVNAAIPAFLARPSAGRAEPVADSAMLLAHAEDAGSYERDQMIFSEGDAASSIHIITAGMIRLCKLLPDGRRQIIGFLQSGDMMGLAMAERYLYTAEAVTPVSLRRLSKVRLDMLLDRDPALGRRLLSRTMTELQTAQDQMLLLGRKNAAERLATFLLATARKDKTMGRSIAVPMSRADIADYLGLTIETVSRTFTKLKTSRLIRLLDGHRVELVDTDALEHLAEAC